MSEPYTLRENAIGLACTLAIWTLILWVVP